LASTALGPRESAVEGTRVLAVENSAAGLADHRRLKNCTARSCFSAAARLGNVPRLRRLPVLGFFLREYSRYLPLGSLRIMTET